MHQAQAVWKEGTRSLGFFVAHRGIGASPSGRTDSFGKNRIFSILSRNRRERKRHGTDFNRPAPGMKKPLFRRTPGASPLDHDPARSKSRPWRPFRGRSRLTRKKTPDAGPSLSRASLAFPLPPEEGKIGSRRLPMEGHAHPSAQADGTDAKQASCFVGRSAKKRSEPPTRFNRRRLLASGRFFRAVPEGNRGRGIDRRSSTFPPHRPRARRCKEMEPRSWRLHFLADGRIGRGAEDCFFAPGGATKPEPFYAWRTEQESKCPERIALSLE